MSKVRVLVGTRKGAFILDSDGTRKSWDVQGPLFPGWEIYHLKGSPVDPDRLYARPRRLGAKEARGLATLHATPEFLFRRQKEMLVERIG